MQSSTLIVVHITRLNYTSMTLNTIPIKLQRDMLTDNYQLHQVM